MAHSEETVRNRSSGLQMVGDLGSGCRALESLRPGNVHLRRAMQNPNPRMGPEVIGES